MFVFKFYSNLLPSALSNFFTPTSSSHKYKIRLTSRSTLCISSVRTNCGKFNIPLMELLFGFENYPKSLSLRNFAKKLLSVYIIIFSFPTFPSSIK